jgi:hypothetical protein
MRQGRGWQERREAYQLLEHAVVEHSLRLSAQVVLLQSIVQVDGTVSLESVKDW